MSKILILANKHSGLWNFRREVVQALLTKGYDVTVSVPEGPRVSDIERMGCRIDLCEIDRRGVNPLTDLKLFSYYRKLINRIKPDVVLSYTIKPNVYGGLACSLANVAYLPNITGLGSAVENPGALQKLTVGLYKASMRKAGCIFFQNAGNESFFSTHGITKAPHCIIPGSGVNTGSFLPADYPMSGPIRFLFISRLMKEKGIEEYFAAAEYFTGKRKDVEFHILGDCEEDYTDQLKKLVEKGVVIYHGRQSDVRPFIQESACLIHPTYYPEGMSNVVLEASATARPVITTRRYGCKEAVEDGVTGFLFEERDRQGLFDSIEKFLALPVGKRREMGLAARKKIEMEFDRNIVVDAYVDEVEKAIRKRDLSH